MTPCGSCSPQGALPVVVPHTCFHPLLISGMLVCAYVTKTSSCVPLAYEVKFVFFHLAHRSLLLSSKLISRGTCSLCFPTHPIQNYLLIPNALQLLPLSVLPPPEKQVTPFPYTITLYYFVHGDRDVPCLAYIANASTYLVYCVCVLVWERDTYT